MIGSPHWIAPEVITCYHRKPYSNKADLWSLGITCLELANVRPPLWDLNPTEVSACDVCVRACVRACEIIV